LDDYILVRERLLGNFDYIVGCYSIEILTCCGCYLWLMEELFGLQKYLIEFKT